jgi:uncharacterized protein
MPLFRASGREFARSAANADSALIPVLAERFVHELGYRASESEQRSWRNSLPVLARDISDAGLDGIEVLVEHRLPLTSRRLDVVLCGTSPKDGSPSYVVIELKQWSQAEPVDGIADVVTVSGTGGERLHPGEQVRRYCLYLRDFIAAFEDVRHLYGVAYLHNATEHDVDGLFQLPQTDQSRLFTGQHRGELVSYLRTRLSNEGASAAAERLLDSAVRPSRQLLSLAAVEVQERQSFLLIDEQQAAFQVVSHLVESARAGDTKEIVVISGGPGSGKSVIALSLLGELSRRGRTVLHATGSSAFTQTMRRVAGHRAPRVKAMFRYFNQFVTADRNGLDVLICDEAHRIRETSANRYTRAPDRTGTPQVEELIDAARVPVFLLDENQVVRPGEMGSLAEITAAATRKGLTVRAFDLNDQFRCGGSRAYENWVARLLGLEAGGPSPWHGDPGFAVHVADSPAEMEATLEPLNRDGYTARLSAGYCWPWGEPQPDGTLPNDVVIGDWARPWNNKKETRHGGAPARSFWASDPAGFGQVGCVYIAQGFEYDHAGVILGPDLVWRNDGWIADSSRSHDRQVKRAEPHEYARAVRNTYKVLLTRGLRSVTLFSTDRETQEMLQSLMRHVDLSFGRAEIRVEVGGVVPRPLPVV